MAGGGGLRVLCPFMVAMVGFGLRGCLMEEPKVVNCLTSESCRYSGACSLVGSSCVVLSDEDCRAWDLCDNFEYCRPICRLWGSCSARNGSCVPSTAQHCRLSDACRSTGECELGDQVCVVGSDSDCRASLGCSIYGACSLVDGRCAPNSDLDCVNSRICRERSELCCYSDSACLDCP